jgi:hypothetical protein
MQEAKVVKVAKNPKMAVGKTSTKKGPRVKQIRKVKAAKNSKARKITVSPKKVVMSSKNRTVKVKGSPKILPAII